MKIRTAVVHSIFAATLVLSGMVSTEAWAEECDTQRSTTQNTCENPGSDGSGKDLDASVAGGNASTGAIGSSQANQCENQQNTQKALGDRSRLAAQNCEAAINKCKQVCDKASKDHQTKMQQAQSNNDIPGANREKSLKEKADNNKKDCESKQSYADSAKSQAANADKNVAQNANCKQENNGKPPEMPQAPQSGDKSSESPTPSPTPSASPSPTPIANGEAAKGATLSNGGPTVSKSLTTNGDFGPQWGTGITSNGSGGKSSGGGGGGGSGGGSSGLGSSSSAGKSIGKDGKAAGSAGGSGDSGLVGGGGGGSNGGGGAPPMANPNMPAGGSRTGGMSVKAVDGITGPMGKSIFEKVSSQYQSQKHILIGE